MGPTSEGQIERHFVPRVQVLQGFAGVADFQNQLQVVQCFSERPRNARLKLLHAI
jgi:hypothetical protein